MTLRSKADLEGALTRLRATLGLEDGEAPDPHLDTDTALELTSVVFQHAGLPEYADLMGIVSGPEHCAQIGVWLGELVDRRRNIHERRMKLITHEKVKRMPYRKGEGTKATIFPTSDDGKFTLVRAHGTLIERRDIVRKLAETSGMTVILIPETVFTIEVVELVAEEVKR